MRIIAGMHKGKNLGVPTGKDIRPTTDRVREAIFSSCASYLCQLRDVDITDAFRSEIVLDAFAGSGACGFEALSRGAEVATFADIDTQAIAALRKNALALGYGTGTAGGDIAGEDIRPSGEYVRIARRDVIWYGLPQTDKPYTLIFLDPPYRVAAEVMADCLKSAFASGILARDCLIVYECDAQVPATFFAEDVAGALGANDAEALYLVCIGTKTYGRTRIFYLGTKGRET